MNDKVEEKVVDEAYEEENFEEEYEEDFNWIVLNIYNDISKINYSLCISSLLSFYFLYHLKEISKNY